MVCMYVYMYVCMIIKVLIMRQLGCDFKWVDLGVEGPLWVQGQKATRGKRLKIQELGAK